MQNRAVVLAMATTLTLLGAACSKDSTTSTTNLLPLVKYTATLTAAAERPGPAVSNGTGTFTGTYDPNTGYLTYTVTYAGLTANSTVSHIHGPGTAEQAVGVILDFSKFGNVLFAAGNRTQTFNGVLLMNSTTFFTTTVSGDSVRKLMDTGLAYVNVHSSLYPGGEIRGQIIKQ